MGHSKVYSLGIRLYTSRCMVRYRTNHTSTPKNLFFLLSRFLNFFYLVLSGKERSVSSFLMFNCNIVYFFVACLKNCVTA